MAAEQLAGDDYKDFFCSSPPLENLDSVRALSCERVCDASPWQQQACGAHHCKKLQNNS